MRIKIKNRDIKQMEQFCFLYMPHVLCYSFIYQLSCTTLFMGTYYLLTHWGWVTQICVFYITTAQDGWRKSAFLICACLPCTIHLTFRHRASCILGQAFHYSPENPFYIFNQQIYFIIWYLLDRASLIQIIQTTN